MADVAIQDVGAAGLANLAFTAAAASQTVPAASGTKSFGGWELATLVAIVKNGDASSHDVTVNGLGAVTVAAGNTAVIPIPNPGVNGAQQAITWSATTSMTIALARIGA